MKDMIKETINSYIFVIIVLLIVSLVILLPIMNMVILGAVIAYGIRPLASKLQYKLKFSSISVVLSILIVVIPIIIVFTYVLYVIIYVIHPLGTDVSNFNLNQTTEIIYNYIPANMQSFANNITVSISEVINNVLKMIFNYFIEFIKSVPMIFLQTFVLITSVFYFTRDGHKIKKYTISLIPESRQGFFYNMIEEIKIVLKSIFYGHFLTGIIIGVFAAIGFFILGYPYSLFLGILTGFLQLIPIIGPWPVYTILFVQDIFVGNYQRAIIVLIFGFGLSLSDMYIRPALSGQYVDIHPMILLLGFLSGPIVLGLLGFILGPLILGITFAAVKTYKNEKENEV